MIERATARPTRRRPRVFAAGAGSGLAGVLLVLAVLWPAAAEEPGPEGRPAALRGLDKAGRPMLTKEPKLLLMDDKVGKPEGIHLVIGRRPVAAFGNSIGDKQVLEYTQAGDGARLMMLVHHDDGTREYAYGPKSKIGTFPDPLMAQAKKQGWTVISMKNDWKRIFSFD